MNKRIVIAGAGGFGREVHSWLVTSPHYCATESIEEIVFINDVAPAVDLPAPVVSTVSDFYPDPNDLVICAIGSPADRQEMTSTLTSRGAVFATFVHDSTVIGNNVTLGEGTVICPGVILTTDITVGRHVHININSSVGHDVRVHDFVTISPSCNLMGGATVMHNAFLGTATTMVPGTTIHQNTVIGAGSVVVKDIEAEVVAFGNPCLVSRRITP